MAVFFLLPKRERERERQRNDDAEKHDSRESENLLLPLMKTLFRKVNDDGPVRTIDTKPPLFCFVRTLKKRKKKKERERERKGCATV